MILSNVTNTFEPRIATLPSESCPTKIHSVHPYRPRKTVQSLPIEMVSEIFNLATYETEQTRLNFPMVLSHVSSSWRNIAFNTSSLWTYIALNFPCPRGEIRRIQAGLALSSRRPLDIRIDLRDQEWDWQDELHEMQADSMLRIFNVISGDARRWRTVEIITDNWQPIHAFLAISTNLQSLPMLEKLAISRCNAYYGISGTEFQPPELRQPVELFGGNANLPNLRYATFAGVHIDWARSGLQLLSELELHYLASDVVPSMDEFARIIQDSPKLEVLSLTGCAPTRDETSIPDGSSNTCLFIPTLKRFKFGWSHIEEALDLLLIFQLAGMEELHLADVMSGLYNINAQDSSPVLERLASLNCSAAFDITQPSSQACYSLSSLRRFSMEAVHVSPAAFGQFLGCLDNVEVIELEMMDAKLIEVFGVNGSLCPKLKKLVVKFWNGCADAMNDALASVRAARPVLLVESTEVQCECLELMDDGAPEDEELEDGELVENLMI